MLNVTYKSELEGTLGKVQNCQYLAIYELVTIQSKLNVVSYYQWYKDQHRHATVANSQGSYKTIHESFQTPLDSQINIFKVVHDQ